MVFAIHWHVVVFAIHWHESAMDLHVFPILIHGNFKGTHWVVTYIFHLWRWEVAIKPNDLGSIPELGRSPGEAKSYPFWPGEFHGLYSPWGCKESDTTEPLSLALFHFSCHRCKHTDPQSLCHAWWAQSSWLNTYQKDKGLYPPCTPQQSECDRSFFCSSE